MRNANGSSRRKVFSSRNLPSPELNITDQEIITRVLGGDSESYAEIVRRHHQKIIALCTSVLGDPTQGEDAAQDIFVKVFGLLDRFKGQASFATWLHRIATNHCLDIRRQNKRRRAESLETLLERDNENLSALYNGTIDSIRGIEAKDLADRLLGSFPEDVRTLLILREVQGLSYKELATILNATVDAVKSRLKRARQTLQEKMRHLLKSNVV